MLEFIDLNSYRSVGTMVLCNNLKLTLTPFSHITLFPHCRSTPSPCLALFLYQPPSDTLFHLTLSFNHPSHLLLPPPLPITFHLPPTHLPPHNIRTTIRSGPHAHRPESSRQMEFPQARVVCASLCVRSRPSTGPRKGLHVDGREFVNRLGDGWQVIRWPSWCGYW